MTNITKFEFVVLNVSGKNYLSWILDAGIHMDAMNFGNTIKEGNSTSYAIILMKASKVNILRSMIH